MYFLYTSIPEITLSINHSISIKNIINADVNCDIKESIINYENSEFSRGGLNNSIYNSDGSIINGENLGYQTKTGLATFAADIDSYDCNPTYARAKCINKNDIDYPRILIVNGISR